MDESDLCLPKMLEANTAYASLSSRPEHSPRPTKHLCILTCMDARLDLFRALGLWQGDAHILRNAGGRASTDALRSLLLSSHHLGTREFGVIHHTDCGVFGVTNEHLRQTTGQALDFLPFDDLEQSVRDDVAAVAACGLPPGSVVWGGVFDVDEGTLTVVVPPLRLD
ncbi:MAG TPA: carbonic anhydrase [Acidimicrobiales bacterium]|jgi:carbonic anhydrase|nr:carbonic anhydrase [Acidimicrobiales bacterium]